MEICLTLLREESITELEHVSAGVLSPFLTYLLEDALPQCIKGLGVRMSIVYADRDRLLLQYCIIIDS